MKAMVPTWRSNSLSQNWFNEFDQLFETFFDQGDRKNFDLACDVEESEKHILFSFDLPGVDESDLKIEIVDSLLIFSGERKQKISDESSRNFYGREYGAFKHSFRLPKTIDRDKIEADYTQGVLQVLLLKIETEVPRRIEVKAKKDGFLSQLLKPKES